ncbi:MAG: hypothetical protein V4812_04200 [Pseudomonadota bacterium]
MSKLTELRETERMLQIKMERLEKLRHNPALQQELAFRDKFQALMQHYGKNLNDVIALLDPPQTKSAKHMATRNKSQS